MNENMSHRDDKTMKGTKKFNSLVIADNIMKGVMVLIFMVVFVLLADRFIASAFFDREVGLDFFNGSIFGTTLAKAAIYFLGAVCGGVVGFLLSPFAIRAIWRSIHRIETGLGDFEGQDLIIGTLGLLFGLIIANLVGLTFSRLPIIGAYGPIVFSVIFGYAGISVALKKKMEILSFVSSLRMGRQQREAGKGKREEFSGKLLDTSAIIDGRIAEICSTGFLEGPLLVPVFVLEELQLIADSSDSLKRNKGRRGLDILKQIQEEKYVEVRILNDDFEDTQGVDSKLVRLGRKIRAKVVTTDYNLNKVAALQGVVVLNINELSNALKPARIPGEQMQVMVVKAGKEEHQGVAYLEDGTMIVVENGEKYIGKTVSVMVTSVLQTAAGRMIFVKTAEE